MTVTLIVAADAQGLIGAHGALPWRLPDDLKRFKAATLGHPIVMGRLTFESIGRPLPGRTNIVLTHRASGPAEGCVAVCDLDAALAAGHRIHDEVLIIGGAKVYAAALSRSDRVLLTVVHGRFAGDTWFPVLDADLWTLVRRTDVPADVRNAHATSVLELARRAPERVPATTADQPWDLAAFAERVGARAGIGVPVG